MTTKATISFVKRIRHAGATILAATFLAASFAGGAAALPATYSASASATLTLVDIKDGIGDSIGLPAGATVFVDAGVTPDAVDPLDIGFFSGSYAEGTSSAANAGTAGTTASSFSLTSGVSGVSQGPIAFSLQLTDGYFELDNQSGQDLTFLFSLDYSWITSASSPGEGFAEAIASLLLDVTVDGDFNNLIDIFDYVSVPGYAADGSVVNVTNYLFSVAVADGSLAYVDVFLDTAGSAIPAPASALVLLFGLAALRRVRDRAGDRAW